MEKVSCFHSTKFAQDCRNSTDPPWTLTTPGHTLKYSQPTRNKEFPPQIPDLKLQPLKSAGGASQRAVRGSCIPRCRLHAGSLGEEIQVPSAGSCRIYCSSSSTMAPRLDRLFPQCRLQKGLDTTTSFPSLSWGEGKVYGRLFWLRSFLGSA